MLKLLMLKISFFEHMDYYKYLLKISWPALCGLFIVCIILLKGLYDDLKEKSGHKDDKKMKKAVRLTTKSILIAIVLTIYGHMFLKDYGDWLNKPMAFSGQVVSVQLEEKKSKSHPKMTVTIVNGEEHMTVLMDQENHKDLYLQDRVEVKYLPQKNEVFGCKVLVR